MSSVEKPYALVSVTDDDFCIGSEVLIYSFIKYNPWFDGEILLLTTSLSEEARRRLAAIAPVRFLSADPRIETAAARLQEKFPALEDIHHRFLSLETFRLTGYRKVVFLDSDIFCMGDVSELFERPEPLLASFDGYSYEERLDPVLVKAGRSAIGKPVRYGRRFESSFSSGVMAVTGELLSRDTYSGLLEAMAGYDPGERLIFTDQMVLNLYFDGSFTPISGKYNYRILLEDYIRYLDGISSLDARLIHFSGAIKPWNNYAMADLLELSPQYIRFIHVWRELLDEVRHRGDEGHVAQRILDQLRLIEGDTAKQTPAVLDRLY
jgi:lipopolysaccharide biosynthesis glycosyltransferase